MISKISRANSCSVQTFYHSDCLNYPNWKESDHQQLSTSSEADFKGKGQISKSSSFTTFKHCVASLSRISGCYMLLNYDRRIIEQTGTGHFSPIAGYHRQEDKALVLDVARFKYPSHWISMSTIYQSLLNEDQQSRLPRGYMLLSRSTSMFPDLCRVTKDYVALKVLKTHLEGKQVIGAFRDMDRLNGDARPVLFLAFLNSLPEEFINLLTVFCIELSFGIEGATNPEEVDTIRGEMKVIDGLFADIASHQFSAEELDSNRVVHILRDFHGQIASSVLAFLYQSFHNRLLHAKPNTQHSFLGKHLCYLFS